jgi:DNA helicase-4
VWERKLEEERQQRARREAEKQNRREQEKIRLEADRKVWERKLEEERQQRARREAEKQTLLNSLKEQFAQNFLNAHNFYQAKCSEHISLQEYQTEKSNYVQSWVKNHLNSKPDLEQAQLLVQLKTMFK